MSTEEKTWKLVLVWAFLPFVAMGKAMCLLFRLWGWWTPLSLSEGDLAGQEQVAGWRWPAFGSWDRSFDCKPKPQMEPSSEHEEISMVHTKGGQRRRSARDGSEIWKNGNSGTEKEKKAGK